MRWVVLLVCFVTLLSPAAPATAQIPTTERDALISLYTDTNGAGWADNSGWDTATLGTECTWFGVTCAAGHVTELDLYANQLSGSLPANLGNLVYLTYLDLDINALTGTIPASLTSLTNLQYLYMGFNQLSGPIPADIGSLGNLLELYLDFNQLSGSIPTQLGSLTSLQFLSLAYNQLIGDIPLSMMNLTNLFVADPVLFYNGLYTYDPALLLFLHAKDENWELTQTIAPAGVSGTSPDTSSVDMAWTPIIYTADAGGYRVSYSTTSGGPYTFFAMTLDKLAAGLTVDGLQPGTNYYLIVETQTDPHVDNQNTVVSESSPEVMVTTQALPPSPIPVLHPIGMAVLISMMLIAGLWVLRNRAPA